MSTRGYGGPDAERWLSVVLAVGRIASSAGGSRRRAATVLLALRRLLPYDAGSVVLFDADRPAILPLAITGYRGFSSIRDGPPGGLEGAYRHIVRARLDRPGPPLRLDDLPPAQGEHPIRRLLTAAGLPAGVFVPLTTADGRSVGLLMLHTRMPGPGEDVLDVLGGLAPTIANAVDPLRQMAALLAAVPGVFAGAVLTAGGTVLSVPGLPGHPLLVPPAPLLDTAAASLRDGRLYRTFLVPGATGEEHVCATVLPSPGDPPHRRSVAVLLSRMGDAQGLTPRELEVMGLLVDGWSNRRIAAALFVSERTVAAHIEHILVKLEVPTRTMAALRALRLGLFVPSSLLDPPAGGPRLIRGAAGARGRQSSGSAA
ncbi:LuxR C-terminal-related transcriptional regulator [Plantactinospora siamensis]|uniref:LuxR C-terminal-related transcriptional regulator n=1 Tax=Plantactinospora siamensis TaxID=555372 RepID=A0ABV6NY65_9ACTN